MMIEQSQKPMVYHRTLYKDVSDIVMKRLINTQFCSISTFNRNVESSKPIDSFLFTFE